MRKVAGWGSVAGCLALALCGSPVTLRAQGGTPPQSGRGGPGGGPFAGMQRVGGEITAVAGATLTIKAEEGGATYSIVTTDNTRVMKGRGNTVKLAELKPGDFVMAMGNLDAPNKTLHAAMLLATDAAQVKALRENLGKTYIAGRVTVIDLDNARVTVERADHVKQTIGFDETTSFRRGRGARGQGGFNGSMVMTGPGEGNGPGAASAPAGESITLADLKVGDVVAGQGAVKAGTFVPTELMVSTPGAGRGSREGRTGSPSTPGVAATPATPPSR